MRINANFKKIVLLIILFLSISFANVININGSIRSVETGKPIIGATISIKNMPTVTMSDSLGRFTIRDTINKRSFFNANSYVNSKRLSIKNSMLRWDQGLDIQKISIFSLNGRKLYSKKIGVGETSVKLPSIAKGIALLSIKIGNKNYNKKVIAGSNLSFDFNSDNKSKSLRTSDSLVVQFSHPDYILKEEKIKYSDKSLISYLSKSPTAEIFSQDTVHTYSVKIDEAVFDSLAKHAREEFFVPCTLSFNNRNVGVVGIRYQGSDFHMNLYFDENGKKDFVPKVSFKFKFNEYDINKRFHGLKRLILNAMDTDITCMRNSLSYSLFNDMGIHSCRTAYARLEINGKYEGLFLVLEPIDGEYLDKRFSGFGDGNLYKEVWPGNCTFQQALENLKTKEYVGNVNAILDFDSAVSEMNLSNFQNEIQKWTDLDYLLKFIAVDRAVIASDGIMTWYVAGKFFGNHNYYWYRENKMDGKFYLLPWDYDATFYAPDALHDIAGVPRWNEPPVDDIFTIFGDSEVMAPSKDNLIYLLGQTCWERYVDIASEFLNNQFSEENLVNKIEKWRDLIDEHLKNDPNIQGYYDWKNSVDVFIASIKSYRVRYEKLLEGPDTLTIPDVDLTPFDSYSGLWYDRDNNFEFTSDKVSLDYITAYASDSSVCKVELNKENPLSGSSDIKLTTCFFPTEGIWSEWAVFNFPMNKKSYDISNVKKIMVTAKANRTGTVRIAICSNAYPNPHGAKYGTFISVGSELKEFKIDPDLLFYPDWESQTDVKDEVMESCTGIDITPDAAFTETGDLLNPDTVVLHIDNIRFID